MTYWKEEKNEYSQKWMIQYITDHLPHGSVIWIDINYIAEEQSVYQKIPVECNVSLRRCPNLRTSID